MHAVFCLLFFRQISKYVKQHQKKRGGGGAGSGTKYTGRIQLCYRVNKKKTCCILFAHA